MNSWVIPVMLGGFFGAISRYAVFRAIAARGRHKKLATFLVNSLGSFLLGLIAASDSVFWVTGFLGAFTTFSTFALDAAEDLAEGEVFPALLYLGGTLLSGLLLFGTGFMLMG